MLRALLERGIVPDVVIGCSAGALNGSVVAEDPRLESVERLADVWLSLRSSEVFPGNRLSQAWNVLSRDDHLFSAEGLRSLIERAAPPALFEETVVPLRVIATDLDTGQEVVLASGPLHPALLASTALPGLFPPVEHDDRRLIDGAVTNAVPISHAYSGDIDRVYVLNVAGSLAQRTMRSPLDVAVRAFNISRNQRFDLEMQNTPDDVDVIVLPRPRDDRELFDFDDPSMVLAEAHALAAEALDAAPSILTGRKGKKKWWQRLSA